MSPVPSLTDGLLNRDYANSLKSELVFQKGHSLGQVREGEESYALRNFPKLTSGTIQCPH
jgi:hypothetical protein